MKTINLLIPAMLVLILVGCSKGGSILNNTDNRGTKNKLLGRWVEISPCDSCHILTFVENDTIYLNSKWDAPTLTMSYHVIAEDSLTVTRNWEIGSTKKTTIHRLIFLIKMYPILIQELI
jgi:hypothetical protein